MEEIKFTHDKLAEHVTKKYGWETPQDCLDNFLPIIPIDIKAFLEFLNVLTDKCAIKDLKPIIYTYWG